MVDRVSLPYQPFYCEENAWHLAARLQAAGHEGEVLVITCAGPATPFLRQRARPDGPVWWDYHVVVRTRGDEEDLIWDLDTTLPFPCPTRVWLTGTFPAPGSLPPGLRPVFRPLSLGRYLAEFGSDRSHMRDAAGAWLQPPPPWPPIRPEAPTLGRMLDLGDPGFGPAVGAGGPGPVPG